MAHDHAHATRMRDHWWWRPGWRPGRRFFTWHLTLGDQPELHRLVESYQERLAGFTALRPVPTRWVHLTMQGVGFADEVSEDEARAVVAAARARLADTRELRLSFGPAVVFGEAVVLPPSPAEPVATVRNRIRTAIGDVYGEHKIPEAAQGYRPHVSLAYSTAEQAAEPIVKALEGFQPERATITVDEVSFILLDRDDGMYRWRSVDTAQLLPPGASRDVGPRRP